MFLAQLLLRFPFICRGFGDVGSWVFGKILIFIASAQLRAEIGVKKRIFIVFPVVEIIQNRTLFYN